MVYEYHHRLRLFEIGSYLTHYVDDHATVPFAGTLHGTLESHLRYVLMSDPSHAGALKTRLHSLLTPDHADPLVDSVHDMLLAEIRPYLSLDEGESVVEVRMKPNYDVELVIEELDGAHLAVPES